MTLDIAHTSETDLSAFVLSLLDSHLAAMRDVRNRLRVGGTVSPGGRRAIALDSVVLAESYAASLTRVLVPDRPHHP